MLEGAPQGSEALLLILQQQQNGLVWPEEAPSPSPPAVPFTPSPRAHAPGSPPLVQSWLRVSFPNFLSLLLRNRAGQLPRKGRRVLFVLL